MRNAHSTVIAFGFFSSYVPRRTKWFGCPADIRPADVQAAAMADREVPKIQGDLDPLVPRVAPRKRKPEPIAKPANVPLGGFQFQAALPPAPVKAKSRRAPAKAPAKIDPRLIAAARELRDRYLERVNADANCVLPVATGKYDVGRSLPPMANSGALPLLKAG